MANYSVRFLRWIDRQKHAIAEHDLQAFDRAILIPSASCAPTDADRPDHLAVNHDGKAAGDRQIVLVMSIQHRAAREKQRFEDREDFVYRIGWETCDKK